MPSQHPAFLTSFFQSFADIPGEVLAPVLESFYPRALKKGEVLLELQQVSNEYLIVETGILRSYIYNHEGDEVTTGITSGPDILFEPLSFFTRTPSKEIIEAVTSVSAWAITFESLNKNFHNYPQFREMGRTLLIKKLVETKQSRIASLTLSAEQRYLGILSSHPEIIQEVPLKHIASYLGITDSSLSRIRKELASK